MVLYAIEELYHLENARLVFAAGIDPPGCGDDLCSETGKPDHPERRA